MLKETECRGGKKNRRQKGKKKDERKENEGQEDKGDGWKEPESYRDLFFHID